MDRRNFLGALAASPLFASLAKLAAKETPLEGAELVEALRPLTQAAIAGATLIAVRSAFEADGLDVLHKASRTVLRKENVADAKYWMGENSPFPEPPPLTSTEKAIESALLSLFGSRHDPEVEKAATMVVEMIRGEADSLGAKLAVQAMREIESNG